MTDTRLDRILEIAHGFPEAEASTHTGQHYAFAVRGKKFAYYLVDHHGDGRVALTYKAPRGILQALVAADPARYFTPAYMAQHGWVGLDLDAGPIDWAEVTESLTTAYRLAAPKGLAALVAR